MPKAFMAARPSRASFASLPDRGDLVAYDKTRQPTRAGAYTWHPVELSEEHALRAVGGGELVMTGPNGHPIRLKYERHVEHPDGNWTWIGRVQGAKPGAEAILTFGEKAVFGSIPYGDEEPLRLTMAAGRAWLMETDRAVIARMDNAATRPRKPDFLLPPKNLDAPMASGTTVSNASPTTQAAAATATTTVDVLLGYTSGFATRLGGQSQAVTRLTYLVDVTNQAYVNSQIDAQVRLVRTMQVDYPDATSNQTALYALTGVDCTQQVNGSLNCTDVGPPASLQPLHAARDQYGADLVSLVRNFNDPENGGCGIAWLIGGGQSSIDASDADTGMSVVSDSNGSAFPDAGYVCRDETLAHEFGHNMGSAHNRDVADGDDNVLQANEYGRYPYSFGYKTGPGGGDFFTIMAYGDKREAPPYQQKYRVFSNPDITYCGGFACGIANQADNARSLRQVIPVIASFRVSTSIPAPTDINGDGKSDLLWRSNDAVAYWLMNGLEVSGSGYGGTAGAGFKVVAAGDYNGDGFVDLAWSNGNLLKFWINDKAGGFNSSAGTYYGPEWQPFASVDLDSDGKYDLLWRQGSQIAHWLMDGATVRASGYTGDAGLGFSVIAAGDFNGDRASDLALANGNQLKIWLNNGAAQFVPGSASYYGSGWEPFASADINADGKSDLMWRSGSAVAYWIMDGANVQSSAYAGDAGTGFQLVASGDYDGDRAGDLIFANGNQMKTWINTGAGTFASSSRFYGDGWQPFDPTLPTY